MGDMEQAEVHSLRRDAEIDSYADWYRSFPFTGEPRQTLVSWLTFRVYCPGMGCGDQARFVRKGEHSYECEHGHIAPRDEVDLNLAKRAIEQAYEDTVWQSQLVECPMHLIKAEVIDWIQNWQQLSCRCWIKEVERKPCGTCPRISDGHGGMIHQYRLVIKYVTVEARRDATAGYVLDCGHTTIDF